MKKYILTYHLLDRQKHQGIRGRMNSGTVSNTPNTPQIIPENPRNNGILTASTVIWGRWGYNYSIIIQKKQYAT